MNKSFLKKLALNETGSTAIEYGLIVALVVLASLGALTSMSSTFISSLNNTSSQISAAMGDG